MKEAKITEIMSRMVFCLSPHDDVFEAKQLMDEHKIHHLPVLNEGKLVGIISSGDISQIEYLAKFVEDKLDEKAVFKSLSLHEIMTTDVTYLNTTAKISEAILIFSNVNFHCLPIVDNGSLVGIITTKDVLRYLSLD